MVRTTKSEKSSAPVENVVVEKEEVFQEGKGSSPSP